MGNDGRSHIIQFSFIKELQQIFQKNISELIDIYIDEAKKKFFVLCKAYDEGNLLSVIDTARELRHRSVDIGAIPFSFLCLNVEIATQELNHPRVQQLIAAMKKYCPILFAELEKLKSLSLIPA